MTRDAASKLATHIPVLAGGYYTDGHNLKTLDQPDHGRFMGLLPGTDWALVALPCVGWGIKTVPIELLSLLSLTNPLESSDAGERVRERVRLANLVSRAQRRS